MSDRPPVLDPALLERLIARALARGGDFADLFIESETSLTLRWEEGGLSESALLRRSGMGIRVLFGERTGFAYADSLDEGDLFAAAETASHIGGGGPLLSLPALERRAATADRYPVPRSSPLDRLPDMVALLARMDAAARAEGGQVEKVTGSLHEGRRDIMIANSEGLLATDSQPMFRLNCGVVAERGGRRETGSSSVGGRVGLEFTERVGPESVAEEARRLALLQLGAREAPAGRMPLVLGPAASGILLHEAIGHGLEADFNRKGHSRFSDRLGERVASPLCTIVDDPTLPNDRGAINIDDEGCAAERTTLIAGGILEGYMHDRLSAKLMKTSQTGNGRRESYRHHPLPRMTTTILEPGDADPGDLFSETKRGIYAKQFSGGQVDIARGDFVFNVVEAYLIEDGRVTDALRGATLIGNGPEVLGRVTGIANDFAISPGMWVCGKRGQSVPVNVGLPHVKISEVTVGGTSAGGRIGD